MTRLRVLLAAVTLILAGCGTWHDTVPGRMDGVSPGYARALQTHTRTAYVYDSFSKRLAATATLETPEFLRARFEELARIRALPAGWAAGAVDDFRAEQGGPTVVVYLDAAERALEELGTRRSVWRVALAAGEVQYAPVRVERLDAKNAELQHQFPYAQLFGRLYRLTLPPEAADHLEGASLVVAGAVAEVRLDF